MPPLLPLGVDGELEIPSAHDAVGAEQVPARAFDASCTIYPTIPVALPACVPSPTGVLLGFVHIGEDGLRGLLDEPVTVNVPLDLLNFVDGDGPRFPNGPFGDITGCFKANTRTGCDRFECRSGESMNG